MSERTGSRKRKSPVRKRSISPEIKVRCSSRSLTKQQEPRALRSTTSSTKKPQTQQKDMRSYVSVDGGSRKASNPSSSTVPAVSSHVEEGVESIPIHSLADKINLAVVEDSTATGIIGNSRNNDKDAKNERKTFNVVKLPVFSLPTWLRKYFEYDGHVDGKSGVLVMTCKLCKAENELYSSNKKIQYNGSGIYNFSRHVQSCHVKEYDEDVKDGKVLSGKNKGHRQNVGACASVDALALNAYAPLTNSKAYRRDHPVQRRFMRDLMDCISIDQLPLSFIERHSFKKLIRDLNKDVRLISRQTMGRHFYKFYHNEFKHKMKLLLKDLQDGTCHVMLDMWTDRQKSSMLGVRVQFIGMDWKIHNLTLAFRHFFSNHISHAIRGAVVEILEKIFEIAPEKIGYIVGDNASNVNAAFDSSAPADGIPYCVEVSVDGDISEDEGDDEWEDFDEFFNEESAVSDSVEENEVLTEFQKTVQDWTQKRLPKLPCYCHLLQLGLGDALTKNTVIQCLLSDVKAMIKFFRSSPTWYDKLKKLSGKALVSQAPTRWNSVCHVLERITDEKVRNALKSVLEETRNTKHPCRAMFSLGDFQKLSVLTELLYPILEATDILQGDKVTSSAVIPSISCAYKSIAEVDIGADEDLQEVKQALLDSLVERYRPGMAEDRSRLNRIRKDEIFDNKRLILATVLDPSYKLTPFANPDDKLNSGLTSTEDAIKILEDAMGEISDSTSTSSLPSATSVQTENREKKKSIFRHLDVARAQAVLQRPSEKSEVKRYLDMGIEEYLDPLSFWKSNSSTFPNLSKLARIYLGVPASSGSVERMFSIAGALQRSRRASLSWPVIEQLLCHREIRIAELVEKKVIGS